MSVDVVQFGASNIAADWWRGGCSVVPIKTDGTKAPVLKWTPYQTTPPDADQVRSWWEYRYSGAGVAVICGAVSGNLEMLELEGRANTAEVHNQILDACREAGIDYLWNKLRTEGYSELTPSGGLHLLYRIEDHPVPANKKIATRPAYPDEYTPHERELMVEKPEWVPLRVLAETRGEDGYVVVAPSTGRCHKSGRGWETLTGKRGEFLTITWDEREKLCTAIQKVLDVPSTPNLPAVRKAPAPPPTPGVLTPVDDFCLKHDWEEPWFLNQGWRVHHREGRETFWTRPGKDLSEGHSASTGFSDDGVDRLFVWTTSTTLKAETPYTKFMAFAHYYYGGDHPAAARVIRQHCPACKQPHGTDLLPALPVLREWNPFDDAAPGGGGGGPVDGPPGELAVPGGEGGEPAPHDLRANAQMQLPGGGLLFTDLGYARRVYDQCRDRIRYNVIEKAWYVWHPGASAWEPDSYGHAERVVEAECFNTIQQLQQAYYQAMGNGNEKQALTVYKEAQKALAKGRMSAIRDQFRIQQGINATADEFDGKLDLLNLTNCTYNLTTGEVLPHDPSNMLTMTFGASYDPEAKCPQWTKFLEDVFPDEAVRAYVQRGMGYSLLGRPTERVMFFLHGPSGTGKSVLTSVMTRVFGDYGTTAPATTFRLKKNEATVDLHQLRGARFVATSEMPDGTQLDEELIKRLTGGDIIRSRALYESYHSWRANCVVWIATNFLPRLSGDDNAIWRRARTIPMLTEFGPHAAKTEIRGLSDQLVQERDGILNWLLDGLAEYRVRGLDEPSAVISDITKYRNDVDSVASWFAESINDGTWSLDQNGQVLGSSIYQSYSQYCEDTGFRALGRIRFNKRMTGMAPGIESIKVSGQMVWTGLRRGADE